MNTIPQKIPRKEETAPVGERWEFPVRIAIGVSSAITVSILLIYTSSFLDIKIPNPFSQEINSDPLPAENKARKPPPKTTIQTTKPPLTSQNNTAMAVTVVTAKISTMTDTLNLVGSIVPRGNIIITTELNNTKISETLADEGDYVEKGEVLARLDKESLVYQLKQAEADYRKAEDEFSRVKKISNTSAITEESIAQKKSALEFTKAQYDNAQLKLRRTEITAPEEGLVYQRHISTGHLVQGGEVLFKIARKGKIEFEAMIPEAVWEKATLHGQARVELAGKKESLPATIRLISPYIDKIMRTATLRLTLPEKYRAPIGAFGLATLTLPDKQGIALPVTALQQDAQGHFVWTVKQNRVAKEAVVLLFQTNNTTLIEGLPEGEKVVTSAGVFLREGDSVKTVEGENP